MLNIIIPIITAVFAVAMIIAWALYCMQKKNRKKKQSPMLGILSVMFGFFVIALAIISKMGLAGNVTTSENPAPNVIETVSPQANPTVGIPNNQEGTPTAEPGQEDTDDNASDDNDSNSNDNDLNDNGDDENDNNKTPGNYNDESRRSEHRNPASGDSDQLENNFS